jgi:hypothetical protein
LPVEGGRRSLRGGANTIAKVLWFFLSRKNFFFEKKKQKTFSIS